jgi:hypothetical protein
MKYRNNNRTISLKTGWVGLAFLAVIALTASPAFAKPNKAKKSTEPIRIIAHVALDAGSAPPMLLERKNGKHYLYIGGDSQAGFLVVDITQPENARLVPETSARDSASGATRESPRKNAAPAEAADQSSATADAAAPVLQSVSLYNLEDPPAAGESGKSSAVAGVLVDSDRGLIYLANRAGLWILGTNRAKPAPAVEEEDTSLYGGGG